jgi:RNA polymerase sigma-70 factor (ECF subfamily)
VEQPKTNVKHPELDLEALLSGDSVEFEKLVIQESPRLFRIIARLVNDESEAESVMQETYLQAYQRLHTFRRESKFTTWLYAIGINLARAHRRKMNRTVSLGDQDIDRMQPVFSRGMYQSRPVSWDPQKIALQNERKSLVRDAIDQLPADYRTVLILRDIEEYSSDEVAQMLTISDGAVRVRLHRARQALKKLLDPHFQ